MDAKPPSPPPPAVDITPPDRSLLAGLSVATPPAPPRGDLEAALAHFGDRLEDTRDALMESPAFARAAGATSAAGNAAAAVFAFSKKAAWVLGTSALLLVVPLLYEMDKEMNGGEIEAAAAAAAAEGGEK